MEGESTMQATLGNNTASADIRKRLLRFLLDWAAIITLVLCFIIFTLIKGTSFMSENNMINILRAMSITTVFGIAATVTMAPDGFDMSACTLASCSSYVFVSTYLWYGFPLWACIVVTIVVTMLMYQLTMFLILVCKIPDMLATCALMFVHQGLGQWYIGGGAVSTGMRPPYGAAPLRTALEDSFSAIGRAPWIIIIMLLAVFAAYIFLEFTKHGRFIYAMGGNRQAAKLSGINVKGYRYLAGMITAVFIAIGGILVASRGSSAQVMGADNYLMQSLAAVFVGRSVGGAEKPNALGTLVGAMLVSTLENGLTICAVSYYVLPAVKGAVLALALIAAYAGKKEQ
jgi:simple sugar transport system permease protein